MSAAERDGGREKCMQLAVTYCQKQLVSLLTNETDEIV